MRPLHQPVGAALMPPWVSRSRIQGRMNVTPAYLIGAHECAPYIIP